MNFEEIKGKTLKTYELVKLAEKIAEIPLSVVDD